MENSGIPISVAARNPKFYLAPLDAIWPPLLLMALAATIGLISAMFGILSLATLAVVGIAILIGDCFGRSKDYLNARRRFTATDNHEERIEVVRRFRRAWCARVACRAAWKREYGNLDCDRSFVDETYARIGYRWWHIFPDGTFTKNSPFIKPAFWIHLFTGKMKRDSEDNQKIVVEPAE